MNVIPFAFLMEGYSSFAEKEVCSGEKWIGSSFIAHGLLRTFSSIKIGHDVIC